MANRWGRSGNRDRLTSWAPKSLWTVTVAIKWKGQLLLGRKAMTNLDSILKSRDITFPMKVHLVKAIVYPEVRYRSETWALKKAECWRTDAFKLCWRRILRVPRTSWRSNQSIVKEISPECSLEGLMLKPKLQCFAKSQLFGKEPDAGKDWGQTKKGAIEDEMVGWHHELKGHESDQTPGESEGQGSLACCNTWGCKDSDITQRLNNNIVDLQCVSFRCIVTWLSYTEKVCFFVCLWLCRVACGIFVP